MTFDPEQFGRKMAAKINEVTGPLERRIDVLQAMLDEEKSKKPEAADVDAVASRAYEKAKDSIAQNITGQVKSLMHDNAGVYEHAIKKMVENAVDDHLKHNPPASGTDGDDGIGMAGAILNKDGHCLITTTDGQVHDIGKVEGRDGIDGVGFDDADLQYDNGHVTLSFIKGDRKKSVSFDVPDRKHIGYWQAGLEAKAGDSVTHNGSMWVAMRKTTEQPTYKSSDWCLAARQGSSA